MSISRHNPAQLPLDGLDLPVAHAIRGPVADLVFLDDPVPGGWTILPLPRWDIAWEAKTGQGGWPKVNAKTGKVVKHRPVWDPLWGNTQNKHWAPRAKAVREVITAITQIATAAGLQPCNHLTIRLVWAPDTKRNVDEDNLWRLQKTIADGLARGPRRDLPGLHLVPDDNAQWMTKLGPRIEMPPNRPGLWLEVQVR
jgi:hypothetical protein